MALVTKANSVNSDCLQLQKCVPSTAKSTFCPLWIAAGRTPRARLVCQSSGAHNSLRLAPVVSCNATFQNLRNEPGSDRAQNLNRLRAQSDEVDFEMDRPELGEDEEDDMRDYETEYESMTGFTAMEDSTNFAKGMYLEDEKFQLAGRSLHSSPGLFLGTALLALGLCLRFSKPAFAKGVERPPTVTATLNEKGEVEVEDRTLEDNEDRIDKDSVTKEPENLFSRNGEAEEEFEPVFGEGSDLTTDPTEVLLRSYLERHPSDIKGLQALLYLRLKKGEINAAMSVLDKLIDLEPDQLEWKFIKAQAFEFVGELDQARIGFEQILEIKPLSARALQGLAVVMQKNGEDEQALLLLGEAVKKAVDAGQAKEATNLRMLLGQMHTIQGNLDEAMELYRTVVEEDPQDYRPYLCQGLVYSIIGEEAEAEKQFRRYRKLCPKDFPHRGFLDELMLKAKSESRKLNEKIKKEEDFKKRGKKVPKTMRQPLASGASTKGDTVEK